MLYKLLVILDILCILVLILGLLLPLEILLILGLLLLLKGLIYSLGGDKVSFVDVFCGLYIIGFTFGFSFWLLTFIFIVYLVQKIVVSLFSL